MAMDNGEAHIGGGMVAAVFLTGLGNRLHIIMISERIQYVDNQKEKG